ncbi:hypothetical protein HPP92_004567 [Vanilla planifolia]|uniref:START domain-containing protein n=1 Tax=Vanilla planifolia TaxID=51239 RepID=A0A835RN19_VANPL|nr:hypothetical protein HPP92_004567 [Vanilla planifolia]
MSKGDSRILSKVDSKGCDSTNKPEKPNVVYEGWMVRCGRRKIGRSYIHMRYFVLETRLLAYYKRKPQDDMVPLKTLVIDGNCRVEDRGLKTHHGHMAAFNIQEALLWKEKIELVIDQQQEVFSAHGSRSLSSSRSGIQRNTLYPYSQGIPEDEDERHPNLVRRTTIGNGPPASIFDWTQRDSAQSNQNTCDHSSSQKYWHLLRCQNGLRLFEEIPQVDNLPRSCSRAMKAVGVVEASCEEIFECVMCMDETRFEWDCSFLYGNLVEEVDGHTAILYHQLQLEWFPLFVWPRDLCYVRYWRRNDNGSYVLFQSRVHSSCSPRPGFVRAHIESGGFNISPLKPRNGRARSQVQHLMQIDLKGWGVGNIPTFQQHCLIRMLSSVAGLREWFSQTDDVPRVSRISVIADMASASVSSKKDQKFDIPLRSSPSVNRRRNLSKSSIMLDEDSDEDEDFSISELETEVPAGKHLMELVAVDWFKDSKRMDHVARRPGCAAQIPGSTNYSMVFYLVVDQLLPGSLLQQFFNGDDEFRNSRLKLIPAVPKVDVDIGSSTVANGVLGLVLGVVTTLVVDMAFLIQANTVEELPERLLGAVRISHIELSSAVVPVLDLST